jgi:hypothetical protein
MDYKISIVVLFCLDRYCIIDRTINQLNTSVLMIDYISFCRRLLLIICYFETINAFVLNYVPRYFFLQ